MALTNEQLQHYREYGYAIGDQLLSGPELAKLREEIDRLIASLPPGQRPENIPSAHYNNPYFRDLFLSDKLVDVAEQILGPDLAIFVTYIISKRPQDGLPVDWHQDSAFFPISPMETFTFWLAADDVDVENGCMMLIPRSGTDRKILPHELNAATGATTLPLSLPGIDLARARCIELKAGQFSVHDPFILHGSQPNRSQRRRCGITIKYIPSHVRIDRGYVSPTKFDWNGVRIYHARGRRGDHHYSN